MSNDQEKRLVCVKWGQQRITNSIKGVCAKCGAEVAYDALNHPRIEADGYKLWCVDCFASELEANIDAMELGGGLVGGQRFENPDDALAAAAQRYRKQEGEKDAN